jgi:hypothetical protein
MANHNQVTTLVVGIVWLLITSNAHANTGIPLYIIWQGQIDAVSPLRWIFVCMIMCVGIEGAIYKYFGILRRPFVISLISNVVSYFAGIPAIMVVTVLIGTLGVYQGPMHYLFMIVLPTIISIGIEGLIVMANVSEEHRSRRLRNLSVVIVANVLTNILMFIYYIIGEWKAST